jgi:hypothetical protein
VKPQRLRGRTRLLLGLWGFPIDRTATAWPFRRVSRRLVGPFASQRGGAAAPGAGADRTRAGRPMSFEVEHHAELASRRRGRRTLGRRPTTRRGSGKAPPSRNTALAMPSGLNPEEPGRYADVAGYVGLRGLASPGAVLALGDMKSLTSNAHYVRRHMVVIAFAALALASCGGSTGGTAAPTGASATKETGAATTGRTLDYCAHEDATTKIVHFRSAGASRASSSATAPSASSSPTSSTAHGQATRRLVTLRAAHRFCTDSA